MSDLTLQDGTEITFNLRAITLKEWTGMFNPKESETRTDKTLAKACGMEWKDFEKICFEDYRIILDAFFKRCREPLNPPNLQSAPS